MSAISYKMTDAFVQSSLLTLNCKRGVSASVDLPDGTKTFVVTNGEKSVHHTAWISFGAKGSDLKAAVGLGHDLEPGARLTVEASPGIAKVAAIVAEGKGEPNCTIYVECGEGGLTEKRLFRGQ